MGEKFQNPSRATAAGSFYDQAMTATKEDVLAVLRSIDDPELKRDVVSLNMVQRVDVADGRAIVELKLPRRAAGFKEAIRKAANEGIGTLGLTPDVTFSIDLAGDSTGQGQRRVAAAKRWTAIRCPT